MNIGKRVPSIGKLTSDVLISKAKSVGNEKIKARQHSMDELVRSMSKSQTVIDNWISNAIGNRKSNHQKHATVLHLPIVLKTLQRLRSTNKRALYFALMNKIQSSQIRWISQSAKEIDTDDKLPAEFYNEVSNMLYRISLRCGAEELNALSKFLLQLLANYESAVQQRGISKQNSKFYRNCLLPLAKTESVSLLYEGLSLVPPSSRNIKLLTEMAFYFHTSQFSKLLAHLEFNLLRSNSISLDQEEIDVFFPLFFDIMHKCILLGDEHMCIKLLSKITQDWNFEMDDHYESLLIEICERNAANEVIQALNGDKSFDSCPERRWKVIQSQSSWDQFMSYVCHVDVNLFNEYQDLDFLQQKLSSVGASLNDWKSFLDNHKIPATANSSVKALIVNTILVTLVANKPLDFVMSIMEHMLYELNYCQYFLDTAMLAGQRSYSGFHCLFKAFSNSRSSVLTSSTLFKFLEQKKDYHFTISDYYFMMKSCLTGAGHHSLYYFLFQYISRKGSSLYQSSNGSLTWALPPRIEQLLNLNIAEQKGDKRILEIVESVGNWFLAHHSVIGGNEIDQNTLKQIFGDEYVSEVTMRSLVDLEHKYTFKEVGHSYRTDKRHYSPSADLRMSSRLQRLLEFAERQTSK